MRIAATTRSAHWVSAQYASMSDSFVQFGATAAIGVAGIFVETHQDPDNAPSDGPNMVPLDQMEALLQNLMDFDRIAKQPAG